LELSFLAARSQALISFCILILDAKVPQSYAILPLFFILIRLLDVPTRESFGELTFYGFFRV